MRQYYDLGTVKKAKWETKICICLESFQRFRDGFYVYFGKPIETKGKEKQLNDKDKAHEVYL